MSKSFLTGAVLLTTLCPGQGATASADTADFRQACRDASQDAVVLNLAAHPDDESSNSMFFLRRRGVRTVTLYSTGGEGGQNAIGRDLGAALALIRRRETHNAARLSGSQVRWLGMPDFGFSKSKDEALQVWVEADFRALMQAAMQEIDPDQVWTNHDLDHGHGHHRATAYIGQLVAAELERMRGRPLPFLERAPNDKAYADFTVPIGDFDSVGHKSFAEQAYTAWREHKSQGPWPEYDATKVKPDRWRWVTLAGNASAPTSQPSSQPASQPTSRGDDPPPWTMLPTVFDDLAFSRVARAAGFDVQALADELARLGQDRSVSEQVASAGRLLPQLRALAQVLVSKGETPSALTRLQRRISALESVWCLGHGVKVDVSHSNEAAQGSLLPIHVHVQAGATSVHALRARANDKRPGVWQTARTDSVVLEYAVAAERVQVEVDMTIAGVPVRQVRDVHLNLVAPISMRWAREFVLVPADGSRGSQVQLELEYHSGPAVSGAIQFELPPGVLAKCTPATVMLAPHAKKASVLVRLEIDSARLAATAASAELEATFFLSQARLTLGVVDVKVPQNMRVALVHGPDDTLSWVLDDLGVPITALDAQSLATADLTQWTNLVLDARSLRYRTDLVAQSDKIAAFAKAGGKVLVLAHRPSDWNDKPAALWAPAKLELGDARVNDESTPVEFLAPEHSLLRTPHQITATDFEGWVQERGLNFAKTWDKAWQPLLRLADPGEPSQEGGLLVAPAGTGQVIYCGLALQRQWRNGNRGAVRLLINLLAG